jgi:hypothetical protein
MLERMTALKRGRRERGLIARCDMRWPVLLSRYVRYAHSSVYCDARCRQQLRTFFSYLVSVVLQGRRYLNR